MFRYYPVLIFCYNRPKKLENLINSIKKNIDFKNHKYFFYCDGPQNKKNFDAVRKNIELIKNFNSIRKKIIIRKTNFGLAKNIISGVSEVIKKYESCIILEDDLVIAENCLKFINFGLNKFKKERKIGSISGYSYVHNEHIQKNVSWFKLYRHCSWSWGTWKHVWDKIDWDIDKISTKSINRKKNKLKFNNAGEDIILMLLAQKYKIINSWAVRFNYHCLNKNLLSICPRFSLTKNDGFGLKSTHTLNIFSKQKIIFKNNYVNNLTKALDPKLNIKLNKLIKKKHNINKKLFLKVQIKKLFSYFF